MSDHESEATPLHDPPQHQSHGVMIIPENIHSTMPIPDRPGLKWGYTVSTREERTQACQDNIIPLPINPPACFSSQEELKAVDKLHAPQSKCPWCRITKARHLTNNHKIKALSAYDRWRSDPSDIVEDTNPEEDLKEDDPC